MLVSADNFCLKYAISYTATKWQTKHRTVTILWQWQWGHDSIVWQTGVYWLVGKCLCLVHGWASLFGRPVCLHGRDDFRLYLQLIRLYWIVTYMYATYMYATYMYTAKYMLVHDYYWSTWNLYNIKSTIMCWCVSAWCWSKLHEQSLWASHNGSGQGFWALMHLFLRFYSGCCLSCNRLTFQSKKTVLCRSLLFTRLWIISKISKSCHT